ncbi:MAG TPA: hypothetical protein VGL13_05120 [Polyangiaceae bacterium]|jgi:hypothetical protein
MPKGGSPEIIDARREHPFGGRIQVKDSARLVGRDDAIASRFGDASELLFGNGEAGNGLP